MAETNGVRHSKDLKMLEIQPRKMEHPSLSHKEEQELVVQPFRSLSSPLSDDPLAAAKKRRKQRQRRCCACCVVGSLIVVTILVVTLALMVFRSKDPRVTINSTALKSVGYVMDASTMKPRLMNATLLTRMSIKNLNKAASFEFGDSTALISYSGFTLGQAAIPAGKIEADKTVQMNVSVTMFIGNLLMTSDPSVLASAMSQNMVLTSSARVEGRIKVLHLIKRHVIVYSMCNVTVNISNKTSEVQHCTRHMKF